MNNTIDVKISHVLGADGESKQIFWSPFIEAFDKNESKISRRSVEFYESRLRANLATEIKQSLVRFFRDINRIYLSTIRDFQYKYKNEWLNEYDVNLHFFISNNNEYIGNLNKEILASQLIIKVYNISYGSLNFNMSCEPFDKLLKLFDNNFEFIRIFFECYIPPAFIEAISQEGGSNTYSGVSIVANCKIPNNYNDDTADIKNNQSQKLEINKSFTPVQSNSNAPFADNINKMRWLASLISSPMLFPFLLALAILYFAYQKLNDINTSYQKQNEMLLKQKDIIIDEYRALLNTPKTPAKDK